MHCYDTIPYTAKRCEEARKPTFSELIKWGYMTKEESVVYRAAEKIGFNCSISVDHDMQNGLYVRKVKIQIEKTKSK